MKKFSFSKITAFFTLITLSVSNLLAQDPVNVNPIGVINGTNTSTNTTNQQNLITIEKTKDQLPDQKVLEDIEKKKEEEKLVNAEDLEAENELTKAREKEHNYIEGLPIFGNQIFSSGVGRDLRNLSNRPTPYNYILGPGDVVNVDVNGLSLKDWNLQVQPDGSITFPGYGKVFVGGKTLEHATDLIRNKLISHNFAIGRGTTLDVTITNHRTFNINVMGEVLRPGQKTISTFNTVLDALYLAGGITKNGTYRYVQLIRNNQIYAEIDLYDMLIKGDFSSNIFLQDDDLIRVPIYRNRVGMMGEVKIPGFYEVKPGEKLSDIVKYAGDITEFAYTALIKAKQYTDEQIRVRDIEFKDWMYYDPLNGDRYTVQRITERIENQVLIQGSINRPGAYELETTRTVRKLIEKAGGLKEDAYTTRAYLTRINPENNAQENVTLDLDGIISGILPDVELRREDVVYIKSIYDMSDQSTVVITGMVRNPGAYNYYNGMTAENVVLLANGFQDGADFYNIQISRRVKDSDRKAVDGKLANIITIQIDPYLKLNEEQFVLEPYDVISVFRKPGYVKPVMVRVEGEVMNPGAYPMIKRNDRISDLLKRAGGFTDLAYVKGASFIRVEKTRTESEKYIKDYRRQVRAIDNVDNNLLKIVNGASNVGEERIQLDPNIVTIDLDIILKNPGSTYDLILEEGDVLSVPRVNNTIEITGQVAQPVVAIWEKDKSIIDYIYDDAGGFTNYAMKTKTKVEYKSGRSSVKKAFGDFPVVEPGSTIFVPSKVIKAGGGFNWGSIFAVSSSLMTMAIVGMSVWRISQ